MARVLGDWLHIRKGLSKAREVVAIASMTRRSRQEVVGWLFELWSWFDSETEDGNMVLNVDANVETNVDPPVDAIELLVSLVGADRQFWHAVAAVGWLCLNRSGLSLPNFTRWMGESAKKRLNKNISQQLYRQRHANVDADVDADVEMSASTKRTPDKSRVDKKNPPNPPQGEPVVIPSSLDTVTFRETWERWLGYRREIKKPLKDASLAALLKRLAKWGVDSAIQSIENSIANGYQGLFEPTANSRPGRDLGSPARIRPPEGKYAARGTDYGPAPAPSRNGRAEAPADPAQEH